jgi:hypothetical protein
MSPYNTEGQPSLTLCVAIGCEQAFAGAAGTILPVPTLSPFAGIEKCVMKEKLQNHGCPAIEDNIAPNLLI